MAYELHIKRTSADGSPLEIPFEDWLSAASQVPDVRQSPPQRTVKNPRTGAVLTTRTSDGDLDVYFPESDDWFSVFRYSRGRGSFAGRFEPWEAVDPEHEAHPAWSAATRLATALGAVIVGDEGEVYDLTTGMVVGK